jgi:hypothetical protein
VKFRAKYLYAVLTYTVALLMSVGLFVRSGNAQDASPRRHVVLIGGLGGEERYREAFKEYLFETQQSFIERFDVPEEDIVVLAEPATADEPFVDGISDAETIASTFATLADVIAENDELYVFLFGHGSFDGNVARLNIPKRDLTDEDYANLLRDIRAAILVFVNTASASGPFAERLSGPNRIVITATRAGSQRNATIFPRYVVEALSGPASDLDKDGALSIGEVFRHAASQTLRYYESDGLLATEFALLEDNGDTLGHEIDDLQAAGEGALADVTYLTRAFSDWPEVVMSKPELAPYLLERDDIESEIARVKSRKGETGEGLYYRELERLFLRLARLNDQIESMGGS